MAEGAPPATDARPPQPRARRWRVGWPTSLGGRTAFWLILALVLVQAAGLTIHALDRVDLQRFSHVREITGRTISAWRTAVLAPLDRREQMLGDLDLPDGLRVEIDRIPIVRQGAPPPPPEVVRLFRLDLLGGGPPRQRPREVRIGPSDRPGGGFNASLRLPDGDWLNIRVAMPPPRPWHSATFLAAFVLMTVAAVLLIVGAVARLMRPVRLLAAAADRLGRDVNAPPMEESGPSEVATAARAFNQMAERIRRFVADRTQMLAAIGHDLRTPITRLRLRAEFMDDDEQRRKMLSDLDEMEQMIAATLAFARDDAAAEPAAPLDLAAMCRTVADEAADARPECAETISYDGPERLTVRARPVALKRALANLVNNALAYGGAARLRLTRDESGLVRLTVDDDGPGIPEGELEAVFAPFRRLEQSRNRETGGTGLGLTIARNILRAHGGDVVLRNRAGGGLTAVASLPG
ncbi:ATP-binding protein [Neoroseomonas terrae]|uniref:ATP-binding protein n=1 Tax=Neoroseomonas terrae TaxID=424799 RepID=UPI0030BA0AA8